MAGTAVRRRVRAAAVAVAVVAASGCSAGERPVPGAPEQGAEAGMLASAVAVLNSEDCEAPSDDSQVPAAFWEFAEAAGMGCASAQRCAASRLLAARSDADYPPRGGDKRVAGDYMAAAAGCALWSESAADSVAAEAFRACAAADNSTAVVVCAADGECAAAFYTLYLPSGGSSQQIAAAGVPEDAFDLLGPPAEWEQRAARRIGRCADAVEAAAAAGCPTAAGPAECSAAASCVAAHRAALDSELAGGVPQPYDYAVALIAAFDLAAAECAARPGPTAESGQPAGSPGPPPTGNLPAQESASALRRPATATWH